MLAPVVVTSSRFESDSLYPTPGATVVTAQEIREAGAVSVVDALNRIAGLATRNNGGAERSIDLRGFANNNPDNNLVVMIDGVRLSENEQTPAILSSVPIDSVERIEIIRGGSSVLYGEGAVGGVIRVITRRGQAGQAGQATGTVSAGFGSFATRDLRASAARDFGALQVDASVQSQRSGGWRDNSSTEQENLSGGLQYRIDRGRVGFRVDRSIQDTRFPGALSLAQFNANPRQTLTPSDFGNLGMTRYNLFAERRFDLWDLGMDLSQRERNVGARNVFGGVPNDVNSQARVAQFSPRARRVDRFGDISNEFNAGLDFQWWNKSSDRNAGGFPSSTARTTQQSHALYLRDEVGMGKWRVAAGLRQESFSKNFGDPLNAFGSTAYSQTQSIRAWELQTVYTASAATQLYAKAGQSYRIPNVDDNAATANVNQPLQPQLSHDQEVGAILGNAKRRVTLRLFQNKISNEIMFNPLAGPFGANDNLPATRRRGVEVEGRLAVTKSTVVSANWQHINAKLTEGPSAGNELVLVPRNTAALRLNWLPGGPHSASAGVVWMSSQRDGGDFSNTCAKPIPSHASLDARYAWRRDGWELSVLGSNLLDRRYYTYAYTCGGGIYPENGRALMVTVRRDF